MPTHLTVTVPEILNVPPFVYPIAVPEPGVGVLPSTVHQSVVLTSRLVPVFVTVTVGLENEREGGAEAVVPVRVFVYVFPVLLLQLKAGPFSGLKYPCPPLFVQLVLLPLLNVMNVLLLN
jgi:hypothetical protein